MENKLHMLKSFGSDLRYRDRYYNNVPIRWFVVARSKDPAIAYENVVKEYFNQLEVTVMVPTISKLRTYFTHEESEIFKDYLARNRGWSVIVTSRRKLNWPEEAEIDKVYPREERWGCTYLDIFENANYDLNFRVSGCCDFRRAKIADEQDMVLSLRIDRETVTRLLQTFSEQGRNVPELVKSAVVEAIGQCIGASPVQVEIIDRYYFFDDYDFDDDFEEDLPYEESGEDEKSPTVSDL